jgi:hypothetical protein
MAARDVTRDGFALPEGTADIIQSAVENPMWRARAELRAVCAGKTGVPS